MAHADRDRTYDDDAGHVGIAEGDPRNAAVIAFFAPRPVTRERLRARLGEIMKGKSAEAVEAAVEEAWARIAAAPVGSPPPLGRDPATVKNPWFNLGTRPDIVEALWRPADRLPRPCRWVLWGRPALVHPRTGVVFGVAYGTIGVALRLPPGEALTKAEPVLVPTPPRCYASEPCLPEVAPDWHYVRTDLDMDACVRRNARIAPDPNDLVWHNEGAIRLAYEDAGHEQA